MKTVCFISKVEVLARKRLIAVGDIELIAEYVVIVKISGRRNINLIRLRHSVDTDVSSSKQILNNCLFQRCCLRVSYGQTNIPFI